MRNRLILANMLALLLPAALLATAFAFQYVGGLPPCEMCWWQRYPHMAAVALGLAAMLATAPSARLGLVRIAAIAIAVSGAIGIYHAGVEQKWWQGVTACSAMSVSGSTDQILAQVMATPLVRCDAIPWSLFGISMAGWNALISLAGAGTILWLTRKRS